MDDLATPADLVNAHEHHAFGMAPKAAIHDRIVAARAGSTHRGVIAPAAGYRTAHRATPRGET